MLIDGTEISRLPEDKLAEVRGKKLGFVFQSYQLIPTLTALENVLLPHELNARATAARAPRNCWRSVGLGERMDHYPVQLSGGEQQRVALARAFVLGRPSCFADEPRAISIRQRRACARSAAGQKSGQRRNAGAGDARCRKSLAHADRRIVLRDGAIVEDTMRGPE